MITRTGGLTGVSRNVDSRGSSIIDLSCHPKCATAIVLEIRESRSKFAFYSTFWNFWNKKDPSTYPGFPALRCSASGGRGVKLHTPESPPPHSAAFWSISKVAGRELPRQSSPR